MTDPAAAAALLGLLGAVFGSFIATVAIRWPEGRSALAGRSQCDACDATLSPRELVPVASYVVQRGRCRRCGGRIAPTHLICELAGGAVGVAAALAATWPLALAGAVFGWQLLALAAIDARAFWLPNLLTGALALTGLLGALVVPEPPIDARLIGGVAGYAVLEAVRRGYRHLRGREGLGGGDPKLFGAIGLWLGWQALPWVLLAASGAGLVAVLLLALVGRRPGLSDRLPFGVMLALGAWGVWLAAAR